MDAIKIYSEKLGRTLSITSDVDDDEIKVILESTDSSLVGWTHGGWNNDSGGGNW